MPQHITGMPQHKNQGQQQGQEDAMDTKKRGLTGRPDRTFDIETGEVQDGALVWIPKRNVSQFGRGWFQMAQDTLKRLNAERKALGLEGLVVFNALMARLDFENYIQVSQADIAAEVDMKPSNVSKAVSKLLELGFIRRGPKVGRSYTYQLHPELAWKGKSKNHFQAREAARAAGWAIIEGGRDATDQPDQMDLDL